MKRNALTLVLMAALVAAACSGRYAAVPSDKVLNYQTRPTYGHLYDVAYAYAEAIGAAVAADTLHPGMLADYGVALALMGHDGEACRMLNAEAKAFPQSSLMVARLKERLLPDMLLDTTVAPAVDIAKLQGWAYDSLQALRPLPGIASVVDSTDSARVSQQTPVDSVQIPLRLTANQKRELLQQKQQQEEQRRQYVADSTAAAKQAAIDARKQAQLDRQKAKREQQRIRKQNEKQRRQEARAKQKTKKEKKKGGKR